jgi:sulfate transport system substrate-binding protein
MSIDKGDNLNRARVLALLLAGLAAVAAACGGSSKAATVKHVNLVAYSTPETSYAKLIPAFEATAAGSGVSFSQSYGSSGAQSRAVLAGQSADVVHFALEPDMAKLVDAGIVPAGWDANSYHGIVADSLVVFVVRKGNPKHIESWADLVKPGVKVITPNPFTSGSSRWNVMAAYGAQLKAGRTPAQAVGYLSQLFRNVPVQPDKASDAMTTFTGGEGDVLLSYEQDAILAKHNGAPIQIVIPRQTILVQTPLAATVHASPAAKAFVRWMWSAKAQTILAQTGYRPVVPAVAARFASTYPTPPQLFDIGYVGGWSKVAATFFDPTKSVMATIEKSLGVSTSSG